MLAEVSSGLSFRRQPLCSGNPDRTPIEEDDTVRPTNAYGESKLLVERMLAWFHQIHGFRYASLRYFNAAGAVSPDRARRTKPETHLYSADS